METIFNLANASLKKQTTFSPHTLDAISEIPILAELAFQPTVAAPSYYAALLEVSNIPVADQAQ
jgi:hypothetical protein